MRNIRNGQAYEESFWDWAFLNECFGDTGIRPTDIDGLIERKGHLLFLETKASGQPIPIGQQRTFNALCAKGSTVLVIWGPKNHAQKAQWWGYPIQPADNEKVKAWVREWFLWADRDFAPSA